jgi:hypothetical protein
VPGLIPVGSSRRFDEHLDVVLTVAGGAAASDNHQADALSRTLL